MGVITRNARLAYRRALTFYALTATLGAVLVVLFNTYFLLYATDVLLIAPAAIGMLIAFARIYDGVSDIAIATWSDRLESRFGRRRPFILASAAFFALFAGMWLPPQVLGPTGVVVWVGIMLILFETGTTLRNVPIQSLGIETGQTPVRRSWFLTFMFLVALPSAIVGNLLMQYLIDSGDPRSTGEPVFLWLGLTMGVLTLVLGWRLKELPVDNRTVERNPWRMVREVLSVGYHRQLIAVQFAESIAFSTLVFSIGYMLTYVLDRPDQIATIAIVYMVVQTFSRLGWMRMIPRWGMKKIWLVGLYCWLALFTLIPFVLVGGYQVYLGLAVLAGIAGGAALVNYAMLGDVADYDARHSGRQRQGIYMTVYNLVTKIGGAVTVFILGWALTLTGFVPNEEQTTAVLVAIVLCSSAVPFAGVWLGIIMLKRYNFYEREGLSDGKRDFAEETGAGDVEAERLEPA
ncbi:MFS transporter [Erythrobacter sp.]|uniref:MFS transporter n=1 Tax=Erythrobacter sp. TaxID=1042 RepID=UPI003C78C507